ncbi:hypothetical protein NPIL_42191 [Nephila pilipes]|uniref:Uncharacterized protein n=1 Tax=Nephila pilipes TaxID=299642 RepID=A0A8X6PCP8_NEPPI|nr:hypothetical protein NPIL_42191 [Nephila pilipes]
MRFGWNSLLQWLSGRHYPPDSWVNHFIRQVEISQTKFLTPTVYNRVYIHLNAEHNIDIDDSLQCCGSTVELILHQYTNFADFHGLT